MNRLLLALAALTITSSPLAAGTPLQFRSWSLCTPQAFQVCASVGIGTLYDPVSETTAITIRMANLQGTAGFEHLPRSSISLPFFRHMSAEIPAFWVGTVLEENAAYNTFGPRPTYEGNASGNMVGELTGFFDNFENPAYPEDTAGSLTEGSGGLGFRVYGCDGRPSLVHGGLEQLDPPYGATTCGGWVVLTFNDFPGRWEITPETSVSFWTQTDEGDLVQGACESGVSCLPATAVPEPATMLLMATGLAGIGGAAIRRRRKVA